MSVTRQIPRRRSLGFVCGAVLGVCALPLHAEDNLMKPLADGWWHLSMEDIRAGDAREDASSSASSADVSRSTQLNLQEWAKQNHGRKARTLDLSIVTESKTETGSGSDADIGSSRREIRQSAPEQDSTGSAKDTTLRDYTTATTRALQKAGAGGSTNTFRPLSTTLPVRNLDMGLFNRTPGQETEGTGGTGGVKQDKNPADKQTPPTTTDVIAALPGSTYYSVPSSPLDVVKPSFANPQIQSLPIPNAAPLADSSTTTPSDANSKSASTNTPLVVGSNTNSTIGTSTATASAPNIPKSVSWTPGAYPQQGFQPAGALQPFPNANWRPGGPNANGFYEPKSISDLQMGR